jgi:hypothetical protein
MNSAFFELGVVPKGCRFVPQKPYVLLKLALIKYS